MRRAQQSERRISLRLARLEYEAVARGWEIEIEPEEDEGDRDADLPAGVKGTFTLTPTEMIPPRPQNEVEQ